MLLQGKIVQMSEFDPIPLTYASLAVGEKHHHTFKVMSYVWRTVGVFLKTDRLEPTHVSFMAHVTDSRIILEPVELGNLSKNVLRLAYLAVPQLVGNAGFSFFAKQSKNASEDQWKLHQADVEQGKYSSIFYENLAVDEYSQGFDRYVWLHKRGIKQYIPESFGEMTRDLLKGSPPAAEKTGLFLVACKSDASELIAVPHNQEFISFVNELLPYALCDYCLIVNNKATTCWQITGKGNIKCEECGTKNDFVTCKNCGSVRFRRTKKRNYRCLGCDTKVDIE